VVVSHIYILLEFYKYFYFFIFFIFLFIIYYYYYYYYFVNLNHLHAIHAMIPAYTEYNISDMFIHQASY